MEHRIFRLFIPGSFEHAVICVIGLNEVSFPFILQIIASLLLFAGTCDSQELMDNTGITASYEPIDGDPLFVLMEGTNATINVTIHGILGNISVTKIESENPDFFIVIPSEYETSVDNGSATFPVRVRGVFIGVSPLVIHLEHTYLLYDTQGLARLQKETYEWTYSVRCGIRPTIWNTIFTWSLTVWLVISYVTMGAKIDLDVVWGKFRRPFGVIIGIVCQFGIMPILAFAIAKIVPITTESAIGLLIEGSCPGGWISNVFALMMDVDFILSITMTFCSSFMALVMMPFNLFLYATPFVEGRGTLKTPYRDICTQLALMMVPVLIGMYILRRHPSVAEKMTKGLKPISMGLIVISLALGIPALSYIFVTPFLTYVAASMLPFIGGILGFSIAKICRRGYPEAFTIAFETGVQNSLLASVVARFSYPYPENFLIARLPLLTAILTIIEGTAMIAMYVTYNIVTGKRQSLDDKSYEACDQDESKYEEDAKTDGTANNNKNRPAYVALSSQEQEDEEEDVEKNNGQLAETDKYSELRDEEESQSNMNET